ncbi:hypothetical protein JCM10908_002214 [Rhodotorula pacifica]|uniref:uncharacterized protein n=1 Tax=Rhodotorula pacifica TaxID=1495444 RepID=UPI0031819232
MTSISSYSTHSRVAGSSSLGVSRHPLASSPEWIHARFERAVDMIQSLPKSGPIQTTYDQKLQLYSVYKQATEGDIKGSRPGMLDILGRAKWDAWNKCKGLSQLEAERLYVDALIRVLRGYKDRTQAVELLTELELFEIEPVVPQGSAREPHSDSDDSSTASYDDRPVATAPSVPRSSRHHRHPTARQMTAPATPTTSRRHGATPLSPDEVAPPLPGYGPPRTRADPVRYPSSFSSSSSSARDDRDRRRRRRPPQEFHPAPASLPAARSPAPSVRPLTASNLRAVSVPPSVVAAPGLDAALERIQTSLTALHERLTLLESSNAAPARDTVSRLLGLVTRRRAAVASPVAVRTRPRSAPVLALLFAVLGSFRRIAGDLVVVLAVCVLVGRLRGVDVLRVVARRVLGAGRDSRESPRHDLACGNTKALSSN